ncbi:MAG TPA: RagB/SusD family nutrient uptake outer membrane protein [Chitinophagaceae bacterium]
MKNILKYILMATAVAGLTASCNRENLSPAPETSISDATAFDQPYRITNQVLSLYSAFKNGQLYGGRVLVYGDSKTEEFISEDPNLVTGADVWGLNPTNSATAVVNLWAQAYSVINQVNVFLDGMETKGLTVIGTTIGTQYMAEAKLLRAMCYFNLLQFYCRPYADGNGSKLGVPLRLTPIKGPGFSDLARSTTTEIYNQIIADLDYAETNLPATNSGVNSVIRAHKNTAISLKTRVYLTMQKYTDVITQANKIVPNAAPFVASSGVANALTPDYANIFKTPFTTVESVFSLPFTTGTGDAPGTQNGLQSYYYNSSTGTGSIYSINQSAIYANVGWTATDRRRSLIYSAASGKKYLTKFPTAAPADFVPVIRWAEVLLNTAEALARTNTGVNARALALLNAVRQRSDATTTLAPTTQQELIDAILTERRIEFLGEGLRNNDLMRLLQTIPAKGTVGAKAPSQEGYIWPASSTEKSLNKLWVDN